MTKRSDLDPDGDQDRDLLDEALADAIATIEAAEVDGEDGAIVARATAERNALAAFAETVAEAVGRGVSQSEWDLYCGQLADEADYLTKTAIRETVTGQITTENAPGTGKYPSLWRYLNDRVTKIRAVRSTDSHQSTLYRWKIDGKDENDSFEIETGQSVETKHYVWQQLRGAIFDVSGEWASRPVDEVADDWGELIGPFVDERTEETVHVGPRTCAVRSLENHVRGSTAYADVEDMVAHDGIRIDDDPETGDPDELWIGNSEISKICEDHAITERALQVELDARELTVDRLNGIAESTFVYDSKITYWVLDASFASPGSYNPNPESAAERFARQRDDDQHDRADPDPGDDEEDDDDGLAPGLLGTSDDRPGGGNNE